MNVRVSLVNRERICEQIVAYLTQILQINYTFFENQLQ